MNYKDRGFDNYRKKIYMSALTCEQLPYYDEKTNSFLNEFYTAIVSNGHNCSIKLQLFPMDILYLELLDMV